MPGFLTLPPALAATAGAFPGLGSRLLYGGGFITGVQLFELVGVFEKVGDVEEGIAFESDIHEGGLHPRENPGYSTLVNVSENSFALASFYVDLTDEIVFDDSNLGFKATAADN
jgi:hypothetical protein